MNRTKMTSLTNSMKNIGMIACAALTFGLLTVQAATAQTAGKAPHRGHHKFNADAHLDKMAKELNLTDAQKAQIKPILESEKSQIKSVRADKSLTKDQQKQKLVAIMKDSRAQILPILTPAQREQLKDIRAKAREKREKQKGAAATNA